MKERDLNKGGLNRRRFLEVAVGAGATAAGLTGGAAEAAGSIPEGSEERLNELARIFAAKFEKIFAGIDKSISNQHLPDQVDNAIEEYLTAVAISEDPENPMRFPALEAHAFIKAYDMFAMRPNPDPRATGLLWRRINEESSKTLLMARPGKKPSIRNPKKLDQLRSA